ncbi:MAG: hypothetical protein FWG29_02450 [Treponema sp.]|nr:hypothetical protein [Treponema sp.]
MQYNYEFRDNFDNSGQCNIVFHVEYFNAVFLRDLFIALKSVGPNIIGAGMVLSDYNIKTIDSYLNMLDLDFPAEDKWPIDDFNIAVQTNAGQFILEQNYSENFIFLFANENQNFVKKINSLLADDISFNCLIKE